LVEEFGEAIIIHRKTSRKAVKKFLFIADEQEANDFVPPDKFNTNNITMRVTLARLTRRFIIGTQSFNG